MTHLRVPMSYWIRGDVRAGEPYISGGWPYFIRFVKWCREMKLNVWADLHGAPGKLTKMRTYKGIRMSLPIFALTLVVVVANRVTVGSENGFDNSGS